MPRDAPIPPGVGRLELLFDIVGRTSSVAHWLYFPGAAAADGSWASTFFFDVFVQVVSGWLALSHDDCYIRAGQLDLDGQRYWQQWPGERGSYNGGEASGITLTLHWIALDHTISRRAISHLPAVPLAFVDDYSKVAAAHWSTLADGGEAILAGLLTLPDPVAGHAVPAAVRRRTQDGPLDHSTWSPLYAAVPGFRVSTMRRRMPGARRVPPPIL